MSDFKDDFFHGSEEGGDAPPNLIEPEWLNGVAGKLNAIAPDAIVSLTQAQYDALGTKDPATLYLIVG